jgi:hypothetical protein
MRAGEMKTVADTREPAIAIPVVVDPVEVRVPLAAVPVEIDDVAVAVRVAPECTRYPPYHCSLKAPPISELYFMRDL